MKQYFVSAAITLYLLIGFLPINSNAQRPDYERYGRIATAVIKEEFPGEASQDYKYMGRNQMDDLTVQDSFQYKITGKEKPVFMTVQVTHDLKNNRLISLSITAHYQP
ncbi:DUF3889 domain-containing protein [Mesobacillus stamsii]|uniref:DUF3889 domain-containing protein n=1 Tax=Mesobacillus stamsii TaxID=225347 RepID=A0ABU0FXM3_9BACI|nr:DUF3889 domain-containing protein [Mesobacillus stamsii]MDQ0414679.1 hypothetical protein [Mesobacillus stamsii]